MTVICRIVACLVVAIAVVAPAGLLRAADVQLAPTVHHPMSRYVDAKYRFSFWYPRALRITVTAADDAASFPGGIVVETLQVGSPGGISIYVVNSPQGTITDEPNGHAAPIPQTKYFYDASSQRWMVTYPEGTDGGGSAAPAPADVSKATIGGLPMLPSSARFDTTIIPLATTRFIVIQDGGGSAFTNELAYTVAAAGAHVDAKTLAGALRAEAIAYEGQLQITISPATLCALQSTPCKK
ncbi:MAG TPA: hypothetical protein VNZ48_12065 [Xanthobacteraceae bacterium]|jgi:hypothetical protein|nr:hypothetical protein [Xanthobacteraceae bacterium]